MPVSGSESFVASSAKSAEEFCRECSWYIGNDYDSDSDDGVPVYSRNIVFGSAFACEGEMLRHVHRMTI